MIILRTNNVNFFPFLKLSFRGAMKKCIIVCGVEKLERKGRDRVAERERVR